jgi:hypothetical protein
MTTGSESEPNVHQPGVPVVFREFLYADMDRARSLFAQLAGGIPEQETTTSTRSRAFNVGAKQLFGYGRDLNTQDYEQRSLLDALFPELERILENGWLTDISDIVHDPGITDTASLTSLVQPGSIVRLTAKTQLFDAEYLARALGGTSVAIDGIMFFSGAKTAEPGSKKYTDKRSRAERKPYSDEIRNLEDLVEDFPLTPLLSDVSADYLRNIIRIAKGMFSNGLHLLISTDGGVGWTATARLQEGRQYLDAEPDILFSRYGTEPQEWIIVGTIGHYSTELNPLATQGLNFLTDDKIAVDRTRVVSGLNTLVSKAMGGFADIPKFPGFSIVPLAVYRLIPHAQQ